MVRVRVRVRVMVRVRVRVRVRYLREELLHAHLRPREAQLARLRRVGDVRRVQRQPHGEAHVL